MRYKQLMSEKNLTVDQLPKGLQKKIKEFEDIENRVSELEKLNLDESEEDDLLEAKQTLSSLDREIEKLVRKFDPEVYRKRLEHVARMTEKREKLEEQRGKKKKVEVEQEAPKEPKPEPISVPDPVPAIPKFDEIEEREARLRRELEQIKSQIQIKPESFDPEPEPEVETEPEYEQEDEPQYVAHQEFEKAGNAQPRKMSKGLILMGVGAFLLTWGAVNFFKERRG